MSEPLIEKLRRLQLQRGESSPFISHLEFEKWADSVFPLLSFNESFQNRFQRAVRTANSNRSLNVPSGTNANINSAIGILNQAVISLENPPSSEHSDIQVPEKVTLKWIWAHVPWPFYVACFSVLAAVFALGYNLSPIIAASQNKNISTPAVTEPPAPKLNEAIKPKEVPAQEKIKSLNTT